MEVNLVRHKELCSCDPWRDRQGPAEGILNYFTVRRLPLANEKGTLVSEILHSSPKGLPLKYRCILHWSLRMRPQRVNKYRGVWVDEIVARDPAQTEKLDS